VKAAARVPAPHLLLGALCLGLAISLPARQPRFPLAITAAVLAGVALLARDHRALVLALAMVTAGWWLGSMRLTALDSSILDDEIGRVSNARLEVTGPARHGLFATHPAALDCRAVIGDREGRLRHEGRQDRTRGGGSLSGDWVMAAEARPKPLGGSGADFAGECGPVMAAPSARTPTEQSPD
jgi:hypothetical protein